MDIGMFQVAFYALGSPYRSQNLRASFKDPNSPFYLAPGSIGPASPDEPPPISKVEHPVPAEPPSDFDYATALEKAREQLVKNGFSNPDVFWEQKIVWGDLDSFQ